jgi:hypothetical protein
MPTLKIGTRMFEASNGRVVRERIACKNMEALPATKRAAAIILSQGISEI